MAQKKTTAKRQPSRRSSTPAGKKTKTLRKKGVTKVTKKVIKKVASKAPVQAKSASKSKAASTSSRTKSVKTRMTRKELLHYRTLLLAKRAELVGDIDGMADSALRGKDTSNLSTMPLHMADVGSDNYDQDLMLGLMDSERKLLREIEDALHRIADGIFGICQVTGKPLNKARLEAKPWAKYCIKIARELERNGNGNGNGH